MAQGLIRSSARKQNLWRHWARSGALALGLILGPLAGSWQTAQAQADFPPCPPPATNEYLLLVRSNTEAERQRVQDLLPSNSTVLVCDYLNDTVVRAGGFNNLENANAWAQYMTEVEGFQAFVARPATTAAQPTPPTADTGTTAPTAGTPPATETPPANETATSTATATTTYSPQPLGTGFAVLVDYQYQPESAIEIQRQVGQAVGLAVHRQRAYLLIAHSPNVEGAASTLSVLTSLNIPGFIVDSQEVVMLTPAVALTGQLF
ncbi:hypothetical protein IQ254_11705 [Nodosilinea sp. LEGE 07088]|uniref:hypothetical protein n=1 Tax=Nodosilinea sp. LEGE 07088 TaxID=2777968 RepID=UPI00187EBA3E|nr:hypothetical protein [Nodosilinea sp. LEGE 07088]MBE9137850.1 hypothetical protein [Nodosilinea sp. LEGE 07088]